MVSAAPLVSSANEVWRDTYVSVGFIVVQRTEEYGNEVDHLELVGAGAKGRSVE